MNASFLENAVRACLRRALHLPDRLGGRQLQCALAASCYEKAPESRPFRAAASGSTGVHMGNMAALPGFSLLQVMSEPLRYDESAGSIIDDGAWVRGQPHPLLLRS